MQKEIHSLSEFVQEITTANSHTVKNGADKNEILLFRGQSDINYELVPSIGRGRRFPCDITIFNEERNLISTAQYKLPDVFRGDLQPIELLALLQHYGIPTRLLDVTENALVALYFACASKTETDGEVFVFKHNERDITNYPIINAIADSYRFTNGTHTALSTFYSDIICQPYFLEQARMLKAIHPDSDAGGRWVETVCEKPLFVYAPIRTMRQQLQQGRYLLFPNDIEPLDLDKTQDAFVWKISPMSKDHSCIAARIVIPAKEKMRLLNELSLCGISKANLFGDSVDEICNSITNNSKSRIRGMTANHEGTI